MTRLELFALSSFIDLLADTDGYEQGKEAVRLDHIFAEECTALGLNSIEVALDGVEHYRLQAALRAVDFASQWNPKKTQAASLGEAIQFRAPARVGETI